MLLIFPFFSRFFGHDAKKKIWDKNKTRERDGDGFEKQKINIYGTMRNNKSTQKFAV